MVSAAKAFSCRIDAPGEGTSTAEIDRGVRARCASWGRGEGFLEAQSRVVDKVMDTECVWGPQVGKVGEAPRRVVAVRAAHPSGPPPLLGY
jgi:hypothetical protein